MLYTVVPLEQIYAQRTEENKSNKEEYKDISIEFGRIKAKRKEENYIVERLESTNMSDYLKEEYSPGVIIFASNS